MVETRNLRGRVLLGLMASLGGCIASQGDDDGDEGSRLECALDVRTSGAVEAQLSDVEGCSDGSYVGSTPDSEPEVEQSIGASVKDSDAITSVEVTMFEAFGEAGSGIPAVVRLQTSDLRVWATPMATCSADYVSEPCSSDDVASGRQYTVTDVRCTEGAKSPTGDAIEIEALSITSRCLAPSTFSLPDA